MSADKPTPAAGAPVPPALPPPSPLLAPPPPPPSPPTRVLNPAHAILGGAILSAIVTLIGVALNIRSSERLSSERDKRDVVIAQANALQAKVTDLERRLQDALAKIPNPSAASPGNTTAPLAPPQSILVVVSIPTVPPTVTPPPAAPTTRGIATVTSTTRAPTTTEPAVVPTAQATPLLPLVSTTTLSALPSTTSTPASSTSKP